MAIEINVLKKVAPEAAETPLVEVEPTWETPEQTRKAMPEVLAETTPDHAETVHKEAEEEALPSAQHVAVAKAPKDPVLSEIENMLSTGLTEVFITLPEAVKQTFREKGEEAAIAVKMLFESGKATARRLFDIVLDWLKVIPGVNKFFLEQEAKIKTDTLLHYWEQRSAVTVNAL